MIKRILSLLCLAVVAVSLFLPVSVAAIPPIDPNAACSLTLYYQKEGKAFPDLEVGIYRVAEVVPGSTYELIEPYASYPVNIHGITHQSQWDNVAQTLWSYIVANGIEPDRETVTDENGVASFSQLQTGLYYVREVVANAVDGTYVFNQFMVYLPMSEDGRTYDYDVEARPKCIGYELKTQYTVTKLWQDAGNQSKRPKEVTIDIYQDGELKDTQVLSADNDWSYTWYVSSEDSGKWTVAEREVPNSYTVTIQENGNNFVVINTRKSQPDTPSDIKPDIPKTGDTFTPLPWILGMCISGILLLILGLRGWRRRK